MFNFNKEKWLKVFQEKQMELRGTDWNTDVINGKCGIGFYCDRENVWLDVQMLNYFEEEQCEQAWVHFEEKFSRFNKKGSHVKLQGETKMAKYRMNAMAAFAVNIEIEASSRNEVFEKYDQMRERGELPWRFVDTMDVNCDEITNNNNH